MMYAGCPRVFKPVQTASETRCAWKPLRRWDKHCFSILPLQPADWFPAAGFLFAPGVIHPNTILAWLNLPDTNPLRIDDSADEQLESPLFLPIRTPVFLALLLPNFWSISFGSWAISKLAVNQFN
jgi:hypothetical protein